MLQTLTDLNHVWNQITKAVIGNLVPNLILHALAHLQILFKVPGDGFCDNHHVKIFELPPKRERQRDREGGGWRERNICGSSSLSSVTTPTGAFLNTALLYLSRKDQIKDLNDIKVTRNPLGIYVSTCLSTYNGVKRLLVSEKLPIINGSCV